MRKKTKLDICFFILKLQVFWESFLLKFLVFFYAKQYVEQHNRSYVLAVAGKFKKWSKNLGSVLKRCVYDVRSSKNFFYRPKKFHPVCLTFDPLGLQMTTIVQNDFVFLG